MNAAQWQTVKEIFGDALEIPPRQRPDFLEDTCSGNYEVRREVEKLLNSFDEEYMQEPAILEVAKQIENERLEIGETIGHYKIVQLLGSGGMGEVYLAEDLQLNRQVAVKILPSDSAFDPSAGKRLIREARAAAALDHPNIGSIYEVGDADGYKFIVMQYLRGETLAERIARGPIPAAEAVEIAIQIADALSAAHAHGVVHRDIKPSNVMIDAQRNVKVLDFSLAKRSAANFEESVESLFSQPGMIFGTIAYMSPEQARGHPIDFRTDIWSFGVVVYEMLTGRTPFPGATTSDKLAAILRSDVPPMDVDGVRIPAKLEYIVRKALEKNVADRYRNIDEMLFDLKSLPLEMLRDAGSKMVSADRPLSMETTLPHGLLTGEIERAVTDGNRTDHKTGEFEMSRIGLWAAAAFAALIIGSGGWYMWQIVSESEKPPVKEAPSVSQLFSWKRDLGEDLGSAARFSPDGKLVAFASTRNGVSGIWLKQLSGGEAFTLKKDQWPETSPIFSPDGEKIAFLSKRRNEIGIWAIPTLGGTPTLLAAVDVNATELLDWSEDGQRIIFGTRNALYYLDVASKRTEKLANLELSHLPQVYFAISPDGGRIAYTDIKDGQSDIWVVSTDGGTPTRITNDKYPERNLVWHPDGRRVLYDSVRNEISQIFACGLNGDSPVQVLSSDVPLYISAVSPGGTEVLYYSQRDDADLWNVRIDDSEELRLTDSLGIEMWADPAPDGRHVAYQETRSADVSRMINGSAIVSQSLDQDRTTREFSKDGFLPIWSPDGTQIAFLRDLNGRVNLWAMPAAGGEPGPLTTDGVMFAGFGLLPSNRWQTQDYQWSPDGGSIVYCARRENVPNIWKAAADGTGEVRVTGNVEPGDWFFNPAVSPNGDRVAFLRLKHGGETPSSNHKWSLWVHDSAGTRHLLESADVLGIVGWSASGRELIVKSTLGVKLVNPMGAAVQLYEVSVHNGAVGLLQRLNGAYSMNMSLSPDRRSLAYVKRERDEDSIHVMSLYGREDRTILKSNDQRVYFASLTWAPDGRSIYFGKQSNWQVISSMGNFR